MKVTINKSVFEKLNPKFKVAFILVKKIDNDSKLKESYHLLKEAEQYVRLTYNKETIRNHHLISPWVAAQEGFGSKAKHYPSSVERLMKKVLSKHEASSKNVVGNIVNYLSLKRVVPMSCDDFDKMVGNLSLRLASGSEKKSILTKASKGDLIYSDMSKKGGLLSAKLDFWKNPRTKIKSNSKNVLVHIEAMPPITTKEFNDIIKETSSLLKAFTGGSISKLVLSKNKPSGIIKP